MTWPRINWEESGEVVTNLEKALQNGLTVSRACTLAGISRKEYYEHLKEDTAFGDRMERAKRWTEEKARNNITIAINDGDVNTSKWYLERRARKEFSTRIEEEIAGDVSTTVNVVEVLKTLSKESKAKIARIIEEKP